MIPAYGPSIYKVPFSDGLVLPVAPSAGSPSISAEVDMNFPRSVFLTGVLALPVPDLINFASYEAQIAHLALNVIDEVTQPLVSDTRGTIKGTTNAPVAAPFLMLFGRAFHPHPLQRPIASLDRWRFTVQNDSTLFPQRLAGIFLYFSEPGGQ